MSTITRNIVTKRSAFVWLHICFNPSFKTDSVLPENLMAIFAVFTIILCLNIDIFGVLSERSYAAYTVIGGWSTTPDQLQIGFTRLLYPFFCGLLISRMGKLIKVRGGFWWCSLFIVILLGMPWLGLGTEGDSRWTNGLYEAFCILVCFPIIVAIGAGSSVKGGKSENIRDWYLFRPK